MGKLYPLHARVGRVAKPKGKKRKRKAIGSLVGPAPKPDVSQRSLAARVADLEKLRTIRSAPSARTTAAKPRVRKAVPVVRASIDLSKLKAKLPEMRASQIVGVWRNAIKLLAEDSGPRRDAGRQAVGAIEKEWRRRRLAPISPEDFFRWPSTDAPGGDGALNFSSAQAEGMLSYLEYRVGRTNGLPPAVRRVILDRVFLGELPPVFPSEYMNQWLSPAAAGRLRKMAESLAAFSRNAKRRDADLLSDAIRDWENDLRYLYDTYYVAKFHFGWPSTSL